MSRGEASAGGCGGGVGGGGGGGLRVGGRCGEAGILGDLNEGPPPPGTRTRWERGEPGCLRKPRGASGGDTGTDSAFDTKTAGGGGASATMPRRTRVARTCAFNSSRLRWIHLSSVRTNSRTADQALRQPAAAAAIFRGGRVGDLSASTTSRKAFLESTGGAPKRRVRAIEVFCGFG